MENLLFFLTMLMLSSSCVGPANPRAVDGGGDYGPDASLDASGDDISIDDGDLSEDVMEDGDDYALPDTGSDGMDTGSHGDDGGDEVVQEEQCNGIDDDGDGLTDEGLEEFCGACGRFYDTIVDAPYPVAGTWMFGRDACGWQQTLERFHRQGGQWVWQFGPSFLVRTAAEIRADADFAACMENGRHCVDQAVMDLRKLNADNQVANFLTYHFLDDFSDTILACPSMDKKIISGGRTFWRIVLPHNDGWSRCSFSGETFDILLVWHEGADEQEPLLRAADGLGMKVLLGMPSAPARAGQAWNVDTSLRAAFLEWSRRVLDDYQHRHRAHPSFAGVYQAFEVSLVDTGLDDVYDTYRMLAPVIHRALPGGIYALSPYWDVNKNQGNHTVTQFKAGFKRLARTGVDLIAPQDGRGTGKAALFWPYQETTMIREVDPKLAAFDNVDGSRTFGEQFNASTRELFDAVRQATNELATDEGITLDLWVNVEAFENTQKAPCSYSWSTDRTDKERIDWALTMEGAYPLQIVSFMWDGFYTCLDGGFDVSLHDEIVADFARPIVAWALLEGSDLVVRGFHIAEPGTLFHLSWYDGSWNICSATVEAYASVEGWGSTHGRSPLLDEVRLPFDTSDLAPDFYVHIRPEGPSGEMAGHVFSLHY